MAAIHYFQHVPFEGPGYIGEWAAKNGHTLAGTHFYRNDSLPGLEDFDLLVIMGGPMNIYEEVEHPWLAVEKHFIKTAVEAGKGVLGICLGAQLIADVLGGRVTKNPLGEIGWMPVAFSEQALRMPLFEGFPSSPYVFQWHNDTFSQVGEGVRIIAESEVCKNQAFIYKDRVVGFQFHMECTQASVKALVENCADELTDGPYIHKSERILGDFHYLPQANRLVEGFLNRLTAVAADGKK